jgi:cupin fold WbuC family metalloprotein
MDLPLNKINEEVFIASDDIVRFDSRLIQFIKEYACKNIRGRARICAHKAPTDTLHEMLIGMRSDSYIRPHKHEKKIESFHLVEGNADIVILDDAGDILDVIELGPDQNFYYRLEIPRYHTLLINSPVLVIHEITNGPFDPTQSDFASFSPPEGDPATTEYIEQLKLKVKTWKNEYAG